MKKFKLILFLGIALVTLTAAATFSEESSEELIVACSYTHCSTNEGHNPLCYTEQWCASNFGPSLSIGGPCMVQTCCVDTSTNQ